ncbi:VanZ family protein [Luteimonas sp. MC1782]|uniref:VanZ family protein n=1 Tax=Luteimonas sp. MC1782 TaxID=2760305 RepID=UPI00160316C7|nr:VanZ family protein [Luteimonas sp. MC1782]MBB1472217.1 VanZ family protein [Luteimonas sp. MC1782]
MNVVSDLALAVLVLAVGWFLARRGSIFARVLIFGSALLISALLFLPGPQISGAVGADGLIFLRQLAAHTPWGVSEWVHFLIFMWLGFLLWLVRADLRGWKAWTLVAVLSVGAELAQDLAPGRAPRLDDVLLNLAGGMAGILLGIALRRLRKGP